MVVRVATPLPPEVQPPHPELGGERRLPLRQLGLAVLAAVEVVHEGVIRARTQRTAHLEPLSAGGRLTLVQRGEVRRPDGLDGKRRDAAEKRAEASQQQTPTGQPAGTY